MSDPPGDARADRRSSVVEGDVRRTLFRLALPVLTEQFLVFCVDFYDTYLSGQLGDAAAEATAAIGIAGYVGWLASMLFGFVGIGTTALVARHWGAGEFADAMRVTNRSIALAGVMSFLVCGLVVALAVPVSTILGMGGAADAITVRYLRLSAIGFLFTGVTLTGNAALRGSGDTRTPMILLAIVSVLNVLVSRWLVFGGGPVPPLGVDGIVWGTVAARAAGLVLILLVLGRGVSGLKISPSEFRLRGRTVARILRIGGPAAADGMLMWIGHFAFLVIVSRLGDDPRDSSILAAHMVGVRVEAITYLPAVAWGYAAAAMIGQSLGARRPERAMQIGLEALRQCGLFAVGISLIFFFGAQAIYESMHEDPRVIAIGVPAFRFLAFFQVPLVASIVLVHSLRGAGDTQYPMIITAVGVFLVRVPVAFVLGWLLGGGLLGAWIGMCADVTLRGVLVGLRYVRGKWVDVAV